MTHLGLATDSFGRRIDYLRISLTDRCNLRCIYCMPAEGVAWKAHDEVLTFEEIERFARIAVEEGISKIRLTGGEPLVRKGLVEHVRRLHDLTGLDAIALTTNGTLLARHAEELREAGLERINISLDSLDPEVYARVTRGGELADALKGIDAAFAAGFDPIKLNVVVVRSLRQDLLGFAKLTTQRPLHVRFIEYMPIGSSCAPEGGVAASGWTRNDVVPSDVVYARLALEGAAAGLGALEPVGAADGPSGWGPARYYRYAGAPGTVGVISPMSHHFCAQCNRLRLTADGRLRPCLFSDDDLDTRAALRTGTDREVREVIRRALRAKPESHDERVGTVRGMSQIGG